MAIKITLQEIEFSVLDSSLKGIDDFDKPMQDLLKNELDGLKLDFPDDGKPYIPDYDAWIGGMLAERIGATYQITDIPDSGDTIH